MKELLIDEELRDLLPPLSLDEKEQLENNLLKNGYVGAPIYTWEGYIVDGHNRYEICKKHNIDFSAEELFNSDGFTKTDVMEWMINTQLGRRNLIPAQRILIGQKFKERLMHEAKQRQGERNDLRINETSSPKGENVKPTKIHTEKELAKLIGVGSGTLARFDQVMKSENEDIKKRVLSGELKITPAYDIVKGRNENKEKSIEVEEVINKEKDEIKPIITPPKKETKPTDGIREIIVDMKTPKNAEDYWNFLNEIECIEENFQEPIDVAFDILFDRYDINGRITSDERDIAVNCICDIIKKVEKLKEKIKNTKLKGEM